MTKDDALKLAQLAVFSKFVVTQVNGFPTREDEEGGQIRLRAVGDADTTPTDDEVADDWEVYYVTLSFDSVEGDGDFRATARVTAEGAEVVDFEAGDLHGA